MIRVTRRDAMTQIESVHVTKR